MKSHLKLKHHSAFGGGSWQGRIQSHAQEIGTEVWQHTGLRSEFSTLKEVLLCKPDSSFKKITNPECVQFLESVNWRIMSKEFAYLEKIFRRFKVKTYWINPRAFKNPPPNLIFVRDLFFSTPWGVVLGRTASQVRAGEEKWAQEALARIGLPLLRAIHGRGTFEGADALWLNPKTVLLGIGNRTNSDGCRQLKEILSEYSIEVIPIRLPRKVQHLLGLFQLIGKRTALLREEICPPELLRVLKKFKFKIISVPESLEVTRHQAMNVVTLKERTVFMPKNCPELKRLFLKNGVKIAAELNIKQIAKAAGGLGCATGIISRK